MKKKFLALLLAALMVVSLLPVTALAAWSGTGDGTTGNPWLIGKDTPSDVTAVLDNGTLIISGTGAMMDFEKATDTPWFGNSSITAIVIGSDITSIGVYAFCSLSTVTSFNLPDGLTSIGKNAFAECTGLKSVTIPASVKFIGDNAFSECTNLELAIIPNGVETIGVSLFFACKKLKAVTLPSDLKTIGALMFGECESLESLTIPENVESIGDCESLESRTIPASVESIGDYAFYASGIKSVTIPAGVKSIGEYAFYDCESLTTMTVKAKNPPTFGEAMLGDADCPTKLTTIYVPAGAVVTYKMATGWLDYADIIKGAYIVDTEAQGNGTVTVDKDLFPTETYTEATETVTVTATPDEGYQLKSLTYKVGDNKPVDIMKDKSFTMPLANVTVRAEFEVEGVDCPVCGGTGRRSDCESCHGTLVCNVCSGTCRVDCVSCEDGHSGECGNCFEGHIPCNECAGEGKILCTECAGIKYFSCNTCGETGLCPDCDGQPYCLYCDQDGKCATCGGSGKQECPECGGAEGGCAECDFTGTIDCDECDEGVCPYCNGNFKCPSCEEGECPTCKGTTQINCPTCEGEGTIACTACLGSGSVDCPDCEGGYLDCEECHGVGSYECGGCRGTGKCLDCVCTNCGGTGKVAAPEDPTTHTHDGVTFKPWNKTDSLPTEAGNWYLTKDVTLTDAWSVPSSGVSLCLNGHVITAASDKDAIWNNSTLFIYDCSNDKIGKIDGNHAANTGIYTYDSGKAALNSGTICGFTSAAVNVAEKTEFTLAGGVIRDCSGKFGAVVSRGTVNVRSGSIKDCSASEVGGAIAANAGKVTINDGIIENCSATTYGGAVYIADGTTLTMKGGTIASNTSCYGGGVFIDQNGSFSMMDGVICNNKADEKQGGGGVWVNGTFDMHNGEISGNTAKSGAGVYVYGDTTKGTDTDAYFFTMYNGSIKNNVASDKGGGVYVDNYDVGFKMLGGEISSNSAGSIGGGVCCNTAITLGGEAEVTGNTVSDKANNVYLRTGRGSASNFEPIINISSLKSDASIGLTLAGNGYGKFTSAAAATDAQYFTPDVADYEVKYNAADGGYLELAENTAHTHDLSVTKSDGSTATEGTVDEHTTADYYWDGDVLHICSSGLKVTGEAEKECIFVEDGVTSITLDNVSVDGNGSFESMGVYFAGDDEVTVTLVGDNRIGNEVTYVEGDTQIGDYKTWVGIYSIAGSLTFKGDSDSSLTVYDSGKGILAKDVTFDTDFAGTVTIEDAGFTEPEPGYAISAFNDISLLGGTFVLTSYNSSAISAGKDITIDGEDTVVTAVSGGQVATIDAQGDLSIKDGTVEVVNKYYPIIAAPDSGAWAIKSEGDIKISGGEVAALAGDIGIYSKGYVEINGDASVTAMALSCAANAIFSEIDVKITENAVVEACSSVGIHANESVIIEGATVTANKVGNVDADANGLVAFTDAFIADNYSGDYKDIYGEAVFYVPYFGIYAGHQEEGTPVDDAGTVAISENAEVFAYGEAAGIFAHLDIDITADKLTAIGGGFGPYDWKTVCGNFGYEAPSDVSGIVSTTGCVTIDCPDADIRGEWMDYIFDQPGTAYEGQNQNAGYGIWAAGEVTVTGEGTELYIYATHYGICSDEAGLTVGNSISKMIVIGDDSAFAFADDTAPELADTLVITGDTDATLNIDCSDPTKVAIDKNDIIATEDGITETVEYEDVSKGAYGYVVESANANAVMIVSVPVVHDLTVKNGNADAESGTDYEWTDNKLTILKSGLTVSGSTTKEYIEVASGVTGLTIKDLSITSTSQDGINFKNAGATLTLVGDNTVATVGHYKGIAFVSGTNKITGEGNLSVSSTGSKAISANGNLTLDCLGNITADGAVCGITSGTGTVTVSANTGKVLVYGNDKDYGALSSFELTLDPSLVMTGSATYQAAEKDITGEAAYVRDEWCVKTGGEVAKSVLIQATVTHNFTYSATGNVLTATCSDDACQYKTSPVTLTLTAPSSPDLVYSATAKEVTFATGEAETWKTATGSDAPAVVYYLEGGTEKTTTANSGAEGEGKAPVNAGKYVAKVTVDTDKTAILEFTVAKKQLSKLHPSISWFADRGYKGDNSVAMLQFDVPAYCSLLADDCGFIYKAVGELSTFNLAVMNTIEKEWGASIVATATMTTNAPVNYEFTVSVTLPTEYAGNYEVPDFKITAKVKGIYAKPANGEGYTLDEGTFAITVTDGYEVSATSGDFTTPITSGTPLTEGNTYYIRRAGNDDYYASPETEFKAEVNKRPSSGGSNTPTITVPVTGDENKVNVQASVSGSTATVKDIKDADLAKVVDAEAVEIDLSGLNKNIDTAKIPTTTVEKIGEQAGMSVKLSTATVTFDQTATQEISDQAKGNTVELVVDDVKEVSLNAVQKEAVGKLDTALIIDAHLVSNGTRLCSESKGGFGGGKATVVLPYEIKNNRTPANYSVFYVDDNGKLQKLNAVYDKELAAFVFEIEHFSVYAVAYDENGMSFADVPETAYYYNAVLWAAANGITQGTDAVHFSPNVPVTRAQVVTFLWRAAGKPVVNYAMNMSDVKSGEYYSEAVRWALSEGITKGTDTTTFSPDEVCTRGQIVTFLARFAGVKDEATGYTHGFTDVKAADYFNNAVAWAKDNKVTEGTSATTFSPNTDCTRAQVVTFLYRWMVK